MSKSETHAAPGDLAGLGYDPGWTAATWTGADPPPPPVPTWAQSARGAARLGFFVFATLALLPIFFLARALGGRLDRRVAALWCGIGARASGLRVRKIGRPLAGGGALLVNHASWLDIMVVGASAPVHFVAKAEIEGWPIFGWIGKISNTVFIARRRAEAKAQELLLARRAAEGDLLCLFPEGTSSDGLRVLPFKSSLFSMFYGDRDGAAGRVAAQPVSVHYAPQGALEPNFYGWWGRMALFPHIWSVVCLSAGGVATIEFHDPLDLDSFADRKALAAAAERRVAAGRGRAASEQFG